MTSVTYPVRVDASLDPHLSRGLWLVKWILVIPHYIVLAFLWVAFAALSLVALVAIVVTGRYPRAIFDFNVGVLRWQWRVTYYAYGALGTDRYPPFTLHDVPDYPAHLEVDYPATLSRGLVLVKWWLLAIPHYLVVALLVGGAGYAVSESDDRTRLWALGLIPLLALVAGAVLLFTGRYPQPLFDLILGLNRWVLRVAGYAALMTDDYPPFRLDQGGTDGAMRLPVDTTPPPPTPHADPGPAVAPRLDAGTGRAAGRGWTTGRVVALVTGCMVALGALGAATAGFTLVVADQAARDDAGFLMTPARTFASDTYAIVSEDVDMHDDAPTRLTPNALLGMTRITVTGTGDDTHFIGIGPASDVREFLGGVQHATVVDMVDGQPLMRTSSGEAPDTAPETQDFWVAEASGPGAQELTWTPEDGDWAVLLMNADAAAGVDARVAVGAEVPALPWVITAFLSLAVALLLVAIPLMVLPLRAVSRETPRLPMREPYTGDGPS